MKKASVYTRGGDKGDTSLVSGTRISKSDDQIDLYGQVDQLNSEIGYFLSLYNTNKDKNLKLEELIISVQNTLFDLGSLLACEPSHWESYKLKLIDLKRITDMESMIDELDEDLPKLKNFILPGGCPAGAYAHVVRTTCRKVERVIIKYKINGSIIPENSIETLNRLSDLFFIISRYVNVKMGIEEILWTNN